MEVYVNGNVISKLSFVIISSLFLYFLLLLFYPNALYLSRWRKVKQSRGRSTHLTWNHRTWKHRAPTTNWKSMTACRPEEFYNRPDDDNLDCDVTFYNNDADVLEYNRPFIPGELDTSVVN